MEAPVFNPVRFVPSDKKGKEFSSLLKKRVKEYFKEKDIEKTADYRMWIKIIAMPLMYFVPFGFILAGTFSNYLPGFYGLWLLMGFGIGGIGLGVMHDANHGSVSKNAETNTFIGLILNLVGGYALNWKIQHNVLHHTYTNVDGYDEDISPMGVMRFSPHQPHKPAFRFQIVYAWFLYMLMTLTWILHKDFVQIVRYNKMGLLKAQKTTISTELVKMVCYKLFYYAYILVLPILLLDVAWYHVVLGIVTMHALAGFILGLVFQPAHVVPDTDFPLPNTDNVVEGDWFIHQLYTTANFANDNHILNWYVGGLNFQIEHHLFPTISHVHYRALSKIVRSTAEEYGVPYNYQPTFVGAVINHAKMLYKLGKA